MKILMVITLNSFFKSLMTPELREEFVFDLANHILKKSTKAGVWAMAVDRVCDLLSTKTDEELIDIAPSNLIVCDKSKHNKNKPKGF
jgi:hypothetical protein